MKHYHLRKKLLGLASVLFMNIAISANAEAASVGMTRPVDAAAIDRIMDDGIPSTGDIMSVQGSITPPVTTTGFWSVTLPERRNVYPGTFQHIAGCDVNNGAAYDLSATGNDCTISIRAGF